MKRLLLIEAVCLLSISAFAAPRNHIYTGEIAVKHYVVHRSSRQGIPPPQADLATSMQEGDHLFATECSQCHGASGHKPTDAGRWMYPRAADPTSRKVQSYSNRELFWIIRDGIRLRCMPAFGKVESDEHIWDLVRYVRTLPTAAKSR